MAQRWATESVKLPLGDHRTKCDSNSFLDCVAHLVVWKKNCQSTGTGFLVKHDQDFFILTAAHNLYDIENDELAREVSISLGRDEESYPHGKISKTAVDIELPDRFKEGKQAYDFGIIVLDGLEFKCETVGYFSISKSGKEFLSCDPIFMNGYPDPKGANVQGGTQMMVKLTEVTNDDTYLYYPDATSIGNSGSPVYVLDQKKPIAIGIHIAGFLEQEGKNTAIRITPKVEDQICNLVRKVKQNLQIGISRWRNMWQFQSLPAVRSISRQGTTEKPRQTKPEKQSPVQQKITPTEESTHSNVGKTSAESVKVQPSKAFQNRSELHAHDEDRTFELRNIQSLKSSLIALKTTEVSSQDKKDTQAEPSEDNKHLAPFDTSVEMRKKKTSQGIQERQHSKPKHTRGKSDSCLHGMEAKDTCQQTGIQEGDCSKTKERQRREVKSDTYVTQEVQRNTGRLSYVEQAMDILPHKTSFVFMPTIREYKSDRFEDIQNQFVRKDEINIFPSIGGTSNIHRSTFVQRVAELASQGLLIYTHSLCDLLNINVDVKRVRGIKYETFYAVPGHPATLICVMDTHDQDEREVNNYSRCLAAKVVHSLRQFTDEYICAISGVLTEEELDGSTFQTKVQGMFDKASRFCIPESLSIDEKKCQSITRACLMAIAIAASGSTSDQGELTIATRKELEAHFRKHSVYALPVLTGDRREVIEVLPKTSVTRIDDAGTYPFTCLAFLRSNIGGQFYEGTGFVVKDGDQYFTLTAASNVYDLKKKQKAEDVDIFIPSMASGYTLTTKKANEIRISKKFKSGEQEHDFAVILLNNNDFVIENSFEIPNNQHRGIQTKLRYKTTGFLKLTGSDVWSIYEVDLKSEAADPKGKWDLTTSLKTINGSPVYFLEEGNAVLAGIHLQDQEGFISYASTYLSRETVSTIKDMASGTSWRRFSLHRT